MNYFLFIEIREGTLDNESNKRLELENKASENVKTSKIRQGKSINVKSSEAA